jgi:pyocin large subunit-like protein
VAVTGQEGKMGMSIRTWIVIAAALALGACDAGPSAVVNDGDGTSPKAAKHAGPAPVWAEVNARASANPHESPFAPAPDTTAAASSSSAPSTEPAADFKARDLAVAAAYPPLPTGSHQEITETKYGEWPLWSKTRKLSPAENSHNAFDKHGQEVGAKSYEQYMAMVHTFVHAPPTGTQSLTRANGDVLMFDAKSDVFAVVTKTGAPRTLFRPFDGAAYWQKQQEIETARAKGGEGEGE